MTINVGKYPSTVQETWTWHTDVLKTWDGTEDRKSMRAKPAVSQELTFNVIDQTQRREILAAVGPAQSLPDVIPLYAWATLLTASASSGATLISLDTTRISLAVGDYVVLLSQDMATACSSYVTVVTGTTATLASALTSNVDTTWIALKGMQALVANDANLRWAMLNGDATVRADSWISPVTQRTGTTATLNSLDALPILERVPSGVELGLDWPRTITDFGRGLKTVGTRYKHDYRTLKGGFYVDRFTPADVDYWRLFLDTVRGSWKAFLLSTNLKDMTLATSLVALGTTMTINETEQSADLQAYSAFKHFEIAYADGTVSQHTITASTAGVVTFTPALPATLPAVDRISYLLKVRMSDELGWKHDLRWSTLTLTVRTTDDG